MSPLSILDDRYTLLERLSTCRSCTAYRARDDRLHREVTVTVLEEADTARRQAFIEASRRLVRSGGPEVYDASSHYLVTGVLAAPAALALADDLAPTTTTAGPDRRRRRTSRLGDRAVQRTRPAVGLAITSTLALMLASFLTPPLLDAEGNPEPMPAVMGVSLPQPDLRVLADSAPQRLRATLTEQQAASRAPEQPASPVAEEPADAEPEPPGPAPDRATEAGPQTAGAEASAPPPPDDPAPAVTTSAEAPRPAPVSLTPPQVDAPPPEPPVAPPVPPVVDVTPPTAPRLADDAGEAGADSDDERQTEGEKAKGGASDNARGRDTQQGDQGKDETNGDAAGKEKAEGKASRSSGGAGKPAGSSGGAAEDAGAANRGARA